MKKFRFISSGMAPTSRKNWLPAACRYLPTLFEFKDIPPGTFSPSIMKRLQRAKTDGTEIILRRRRGCYVGVKLVDKEARQLINKRRKNQIRELKKSLKHVYKNNEVKSCLRMLMSLEKLTNNKSWLDAHCQMLEKL